MKLNCLLLLPFLLLVACKSSEGETNKNMPEPAPDSGISGTNLVIPDNSDKDEYQLLLFGNSHIGGLATLLTTLINHGLPSKTFTVRSASSQRYLAERLSDGLSLDILKNDAWTHVILQAQKYSQSGAYDYPTVGAQRWIQLAKEQQATPILFPEHPQQGNKTEGQRLYALHKSIAAKQSACVAPIGLVWDKVIALRPELELHHSDGNHASELGKFLSALVFYEILTGRSADLLTYIPTLDVDAQTQDLFGQIVSQVIAENPPCVNA